MPGGDRTGPVGNGPFTGRGLGYCVSNQAPVSPAYGRGLGNRRGFARGLRRGYGNYPYPAPLYNNGPENRESDVAYLKETARSLENELNHVKDQIGKLEDKETE